MRLRARVFWTPKGGSTEEEYEDAYWPTRDIDGRLKGFRCAVGDGATESSFSGLWARLLVRAYCRKALDGRRLDRSLRELACTWRSQAVTGALPWYAEQKLEQGAFSSLLGLQIGEDGQWRSSAVGDTCLFHLRGGDVREVFPVERADDFTNSPVLISSAPHHNRTLSGYARELSGEWERGDVFLLMTDAIACWYLRCIEEGGCPSIPRRRPSFGPWLARMRNDGAVRNDDTTLMRVEML